MGALRKALVAPCLLGLLVTNAAPPAFAQSTGGVAVSLAYRMPPGWGRSALGPNSVYVIRDGDKVHTITVQSVPPKSATDVETYAAAQIASEKQRGAEVVDEGATTVCEGQAAHRWTVRSASTGVAMEMQEMHMLAAAVTGGIATMTYGHRVGVGDRRDALDAILSLCPGPYPTPVPAGWTAPKGRTGVPSGSIESPDGTSTFVTAYRPMDPEKFPAYERDAAPAGTVLADHRDPCSGGSVHRVDVQVGNQISEVSVALVHRIAYRYVYTRPAAHEADPGAERALTAFCRPFSPVPAGSVSPT